MLKYKITVNGMKKHIMNDISNSNRMTLEDKLLAILSSGLGYSPSSLYGCAKADEAISKRVISEGSVEKTLVNMEEQELVISFNQEISL